MPAGPVDPGVLGARLRQQTEINDPTTGAADPLEVEARSELWPHTSRWALIELIQVSQSGARRLEEYRFTPTAHAQGLPQFHGPGLPVAIAFERSPNGASRARIYSARALDSGPRSCLAADGHLPGERGPEGILARYFAALQAADLAATLALFEPQGYLQRSDGRIYQGHESLRARFTQIYQSGGTTLRFCSRIDEGARTVLEVCLPDDRPAAAVYERGGAGLLAAVREYR